LIRLLPSRYDDKGTGLLFIVLTPFGWSVACQVCFHDTEYRKPHPAPIHKALETLCLDGNDVISVGDMPHDIEAARRAGVFAVAAIWGSTDVKGLIGSNPDAIVNTVSELRDLLIQRLPQLAHLNHG